MPTLGAEASAVQSPMLRYAQDIGWALVREVGVHAGEVLKRLTVLPSRNEGNRDMLDLLRGETSV